MSSKLRFSYYLIACAVAVSCSSLLRAEKTLAPGSESPEPDLFELSLGYSYLHLGDAFPETEHLHGFDFSAFVNALPWLSVGGDFSAGFGKTTQRARFPFIDVEIDSRRFVYVFGPRFDVWQNSRCRLFLETLAGAVHAEAELSYNSRFGQGDRTVTDDSFAAAVGAGFDWRFARNFSWRIIQADYVPTNVGHDWQSNFRASTGLVYSFGGR